MAENVVTRYDPHFHLGMRVITLIWCFRGWQVWLWSNYLSMKLSLSREFINIFMPNYLW